MSNISNHIARIADSLKGREISGDCAYPLVMGVLNVSADSFSDGGKYLSDESALEQAEKMLSEGAAIVDIGAESTRPNAKPLSREEELRLLIPKIRAVRAAFPKVPISVDTYKPEVAAEALVNGADIINDVFVGMENGRCPMGKVAADFKCPVIVMHNSRGEKIGGDFFADLKNGIEKRISAVEREGVSRDRIIIDPGFGFGKSVFQNFEIIARLAELRAFNCAVLLGVSRKSSLASIAGGDPEIRDTATAAVSAVSTFAKSADILRVHDVAKNVAAVRTANEILRWTK